MFIGMNMILELKTSEAALGDRESGGRMGGGALALSPLRLHFGFASIPLQVQLEINANGLSFHFEFTST